jgi:hypothetical protein
MTEAVSWIAFAFAVLVTVERIFNRIKKSKCSCCGTSAEVVTELDSPKKETTNEKETTKL